jgi:DNA-binding MarR family transcriptional regulator
MLDAMFGAAALRPRGGPPPRRGRVAPHAFLSIRERATFCSVLERDIIAQSESRLAVQAMASGRSSGKQKDAAADPILRHWRDAVPHDRLAHLVKDAARAMVRGLQMRLAQHEVSFGHWTFLRILWETDGLTQKELSIEAGVMTPTTFTAVNAMEKLGYVVRRQSPENKKNTYVYLTQKGKQLKRKLVPLAEEVNEIGVKGLKPSEIAIARKVLLTVIENMAKDEAQSTDPSRRIPSTRELGNLIATRGEEYENS